MARIDRRMLARVAGWAMLAAALLSAVAVRRSPTAPDTWTVQIRLGEWQFALIVCGIALLVLFRGRRER